MRSLGIDQSFRARVIKLVAARLKWPAGQTESVLDQRVWVGATTEQVKASWGRPRDIGRHLSADSRLEFWHYGSDIATHSMVTFENGRCTSISQ